MTQPLTLVGRADLISLVDRMRKLLLRVAPHIHEDTPDLPAILGEIEEVTGETGLGDE